VEETEATRKQNDKHVRFPTLMIDLIMADLKNHMRVILWWCILNANILKTTQLGPFECCCFFYTFQEVITFVLSEISQAMFSLNLINRVKYSDLRMFYPSFQKKNFNKENEPYSGCKSSHRLYSGELP
jgi:hypothetical protein